MFIPEATRAYWRAFSVKHDYEARAAQIASLSDRPPRVVTPAQRAARSENMRKFHAKRKAALLLKNKSLVG